MCIVQVFPQGGRFHSQPFVSLPASIRPLKIASICGSPPGTAGSSCDEAKAQMSWDRSVWAWKSLLK